MPRARAAALALLLLAASFATAAGGADDSKPSANGSSAAASASAAQLGGSFVLDGNLDEWREPQEPFAFAAALGATRLRARIGYADAGLVIGGEIDGAVPAWAASRAELATKAHLVVWLAHQREPTLPPIGWGNQFDDVSLYVADDCAAETDAAENEATCRRWFAQQVSYRATVARLFLRRWRVTAAAADETYAATAWQSLSPAEQASLAPLAPRGTPEMRLAPSTGSTPARLEILIPWAAMPPLDSLYLDGVRLGLELGPAGGLPAAGAPEAIRTALTSVRNFARRFQLTPCRYDLAGNFDTKPGADNAVPYIAPVAEDDLRSVIVLHNNAAGYQYVPDPDTRSPVAETAALYANDLGQDRVLCWPRLALAMANRRVQTDHTILTSEPASRLLPSYRLLLKDGPLATYSYYGSGQCGACPRVYLNMYLVDLTTGGITEAFQFGGIVDPSTSDLEIQVSSDDWRQITVYNGTLAPDADATSWTAIVYCRSEENGTYSVCKESHRVPEPSPRQLEYPD